MCPVVVFLHRGITLFSTGSFAGMSIGTRFARFTRDASFGLPEVLPKHQIHVESFSNKSEIQHDGAGAMFTR